ncbi:hypothetical protein EON80_10655 [bacterium]|nr:MAG: hypothetical protein EON80_10655 [bacterium]
MSPTLIVFDAVLLLTFLVGWAEATTSFQYRLTLVRFLRASAVPVLAIIVLHLMWVFNVGIWIIRSFPFPPGAKIPWFVSVLLLLVGAIVGLAMMVAIPLTVVRLVEFVADQFAPDFIEPDL